MASPQPTPLKFDAKTLAALELGDAGDRIFFDPTLPGFGLRLRRAAGGKMLRSWICQYKRHGKSRRLLLGSADVLSLETARTAAKKMLAKVALGEDPQAAKADRRAKDQHTLRAVAAEFLIAREGELSPRTLAEFRRYLTDPHYFGPLHTRPIDTIERRDIAACVVTVTRSSGAVTAARARTAIGAMFTWCMRMGLAESNPTIGTIRPDEGPARERVLSDDELVAVWHACGDDEYGRIIRLLIMTGCRRSEIGDLRWSEIDLERGTLTIPSERSKNGRAHTLPLTSLTREILKSVPHRVTRDQLFGARSHGYTLWSIDKRALDQRSGVKDWLVHDLGRSVATRMADLGVAPHVIEAVLNHVSGHKAGIAGIYNRSSYAREMRAALTLWDDHVRSIVAGNERKILLLPQTAR
jgi:integrase